MRLALLALLLIPFAFGTHAQPTSNKPPDNAPFSKNTKGSEHNVYSSSNHAFTIEPTLLPRGVAAFNYFSKLKKLPFFYKIGYGRSFSRDFIAIEKDISTTGFNINSIQYVLEGNRHHLHLFQGGLGYLFYDDDGLQSTGLMLHFSQGRANIPTSALSALRVTGERELKYRTTTVGISFCYFRPFDSNKPVFFSGLNFGFGLTNYAMSRSYLIPGTYNEYKVLKPMDNVEMLALLFNIQFGLGW
jgi:hypothetical protein